MYTEDYTAQKISFRDLDIFMEIRDLIFYLEVNKNSLTIKSFREYVLKESDYKTLENVIKARYKLGSNQIGGYLSQMGEIKTYTGKLPFYFQRVGTKDYRYGSFFTKISIDDYLSDNYEKYKVNLLQDRALRLHWLTDDVSGNIVDSFVLNKYDCLHFFEINLGSDELDVLEGYYSYQDNKAIGSISEVQCFIPSSLFKKLEEEGKIKYLGYEDLL